MLLGEDSKACPYCPEAANYSHYSANSQDQGTLHDVVNSEDEEESPQSSKDSHQVPAVVKAVNPHEEQKESPQHHKPRNASSRRFTDQPIWSNRSQKAKISQNAS